MSDIASGDVTYLVLKQRKLSDSRNMNLVRLSFGNGALTYPANGIPILKGKCGCSVDIESMVVVDQGASGYRFQYDQSAEKLIVMQAPNQTHSHDIKAIGGLTSSEPLLLDASQVFGKNAATNRTIVGANSATTGGVVSSTLAAAALAEASTVAIAAQVIEVEVIGY